MKTTTPTHNAADFRHRTRNANRGVAYLLVIAALAVAVIVSLGFALSGATTTAIAQNVKQQAQARAIAESALEMSISYLRASADWRNTEPNGQWFADQPLLGGSFSLSVEDGQDTDGDGLPDGDGDLADDSAEPFTVTVIGRFQGVTHRAQAVVTPGEIALGPIKVLMVVDSINTLSAIEASRKDLIESWGWSVTLIQDTAPQADYDQAMLDIHVVYVPASAGSAVVASRLVATELGVVFEEGGMNHGLSVSDGQGAANASIIRIVDNSHYITQPFDIGELEVANAARKIEHPSGSVAAGLRPLAWLPGSERPVIGAVDSGSALIDSQTAAGRRVASPFAGCLADDLTEPGVTLFKRMLQWGAQSALLNDAVEPITDWQRGENFRTADGEDRLLVVVIGAETHKSINEVTFGQRTMTLANSAYESTGVGARAYIYYLREASIKAASDSRIRIDWTGRPSEQHIAARMYQYVSQSTPLRATATHTNAGPPTIQVGPMEVSDGDMVVATAQVGQPRSYTWDAPLDEGVDHTGWTSAQGAADYPVAGNPGSVTAAATCSLPNRQAMVAAVLQPRSQSSGSGAVPQLLVHYEFHEETAPVELIGHWRGDDSGNSGTLAIQDDVYLYQNAVIDGYNSADGPYSAANRQQDIILVTNTSSNIDVRHNSAIYGSTYNRPGANPTNVVRLDSSATITGNRYEQSVAFDLPDINAPQNMGSSKGRETFKGGNHIINSDVKYDDLTINAGAVITIVGDVRIEVTDDFRMNGGTILVPDGSRLRLYVNDDIKMLGDSAINTDTAAPQRVEIQQYGSSPSFDMNSTSSIAGIVHVGRDLRMSHNAAIYGAVTVADDLDLRQDAAVHIDRNLPGYHIIPVADEIGMSDGLAHGDVTFGQPGAAAHTGTSLQFDGDTGFVVIRHEEQMLLDQASIAFWFNSESLSGQRAIISKDSSDFDSGGHLHIYTDGATLKARLQTDGSSPYGSGDSFEVAAPGMTTNTWRHVVLTMGTNGLRLYVNGQLADHADYPGALGASSGGIGNNEPLVIGAGTTNSGDLDHLPLNQHFKGRIDDVQLYDGVLDANQVDNLRQGQALGDRDDPGYIVRDTSGFGQPADLFLDHTEGVAWLDDGGLTITRDLVIRAPQPPAKIRNGVTATGQFTVEIIAQTSKNDSADRRLLHHGPPTGNDVNLDIWQQSRRHMTRIRSADSGDAPEQVESEQGVESNTQQHLVITFDGQVVRIYRDGEMVGEAPQTGDMLNWATNFGFTLANLPDGSAPWLGTLKEVAIYDRAMNQKQLDNLFQGLPPGDGASAGTGGLQVMWYENP